MANSAWFVCFLGWSTIILHLLPGFGLTGLWGVDALAYLPRGFSLAWSALTAILLVPPLAERWLPPESPRHAPSVYWKYAWLSAPLSLFLFPLFATATPLLGDGLDRIEALARGFKALRGQPAPLDIALHLGLFQLAGWLDLGATAFRAGWKTYRLISYLAGALAMAAFWKLADRWGQSSWQRALVFAGLVSMGTTVLFCGYPENYSLLAAMLFVHLWLLDRSQEPGRSPFWPLLSLLGMILLHFFALLLLPPTFYFLFRFSRWRPSRTTVAGLLAAGLTFLAFLALMVERHYRGAKAIFLSGSQLFSFSRMVDVLNEQFLVCPALLVLLYLAFVPRRQESISSPPILTYLVGASLIWLLFFYALRPVLGAGPDWDLFSLPALVYTPALLLRAREKLALSPRGRYLSWAVLLVAGYHTIPWIAVNARHDAAISRYENLMVELEGKNPWAAGYGWLKLGKYWQNRGQIEPALRAYERSLAANPTYSVLYREIGQRMLEIGRLELAVSHFENFLTLNPTNPGGRPALAKARELYAEQLAWQGRLSEAAAQYEAILQLYPENQQAQTRLAQLRGQLKNPSGESP